ncbi:hypothetical protein [Paraburkholderia dinghuensis]|nr:hypothetical protein [Paraburkholderia dinghuensis]
MAGFIIVGHVVIGVLRASMVKGLFPIFGGEPFCRSRVPALTTVG